MGWTAHIAEDSYSKGIVRSEASVTRLEEEVNRLYAQSILANDQVRRLIGQVGELNDCLRWSQELVDKQAAEILLQIQGRKAKEEACKTKDSAIASAEARIRELEVSLTSSEDKL